MRITFGRHQNHVIIVLRNITHTGTHATNWWRTNRSRGMKLRAHAPWTMPASFLFTPLPRMLRCYWPMNRTIKHHFGLDSMILVWVETILQSFGCWTKFVLWSDTAILETIYKFLPYFIDLRICMNFSIKQECIPVGCVPSAAMAVSGWAFLPGVVVSA